MDGQESGVVKKYREYKTKTEQFMQEMENTLTDFEKNKDPQKLYERTRDAIRRFSGA